MQCHANQVESIVWVTLETQAVEYSETCLLWSRCLVQVIIADSRLIQRVVPKLLLLDRSTVLVQLSSLDISSS